MKTAPPPEAPPRRTVSLRDLIGSGDRIMLFTLPFVIVGLIMNAAYPALFQVEGSTALTTLAVVLLIPGVVLWLWAVALILRDVPRGELITTGPFALMKHPIYTSVALLVLPGIGLLFDSWLGAFIGVALYVGSRIFSKREEDELSRTFGARWDAYREHVLMPWL